MNLLQLYAASLSDCLLTIRPLAKDKSKINDIVGALSVLHHPKPAIDTSPGHILMIYKDENGIHEGKLLENIMRYNELINSGSTGWPNKDPEKFLDFVTLTMSWLNPFSHVTFQLYDELLSRFMEAWYVGLETCSLEFLVPPAMDLPELMPNPLGFSGVANMVVGHLDIIKSDLLAGNVAVGKRLIQNWYGDVMPLATKLILRSTL